MAGRSRDASHGAPRHRQVPPRHPKSGWHQPPRSLASPSTGAAAPAVPFGTGHQTLHPKPCKQGLPSAAWARRGPHPAPAGDAEGWVQEEEARRGEGAVPQAAPSRSARLAGHKPPPSPPHPRSHPPPATTATAAAAVRGGCTKNKKAFGVFTAEVSRLPPGSLCRRSRRALQLTLGLYRRKPAASQRNYCRPQRSPSHLLGQTVSAALPSRKSPPPSSS